MDGESVKWTSVLYALFSIFCTHSHYNPAFAYCEIKSLKYLQRNNYQEKVFWTCLQAWELLCHLLPSERVFSSCQIAAFCCWSLPQVRTKWHCLYVNYVLRQSLSLTNVPRLYVHCLLYVYIIYIMLLLLLITVFNFSLLVCIYM